MYTHSRRSAEQLTADRKLIRRLAETTRDIEIRLLPLFESRQLQAEITGSGGALVPEGFVQVLEYALYSDNVIRRLATVTRLPNGRPMAVPSTDDTMNAGVTVSEDSPIPEIDIVFGQLILKPTKTSSGRIVVPKELISADDGGDAFAGAEEWLAKVLGERITRAQLVAFSVGIIPGTAGGVLGEIAGANAITASSSTAISGDDLLVMPTAVNVAYLDSPNVGYMFHPKIWEYVRRLKDSTGRDLFPQKPGERHISEYPVYLNPAFPSTIVAGSITAAFGAWDRVRVADANTATLTAYDEAVGLVENDQTAIQARLRSACNLIDPAGKALVVLQQPTP